MMLWLKGVSWPKDWSDLMDESGSAYNEEVDSAKYEAEKGLLELYRTFVTELLRISLAGIAVLGFISKLSGGNLNCASKSLGIISMICFAGSSSYALFFLYASANGYRCYIAGLRAEASNIHMKHNSGEYLKKRKAMLKYCERAKSRAALLLFLGAFAATVAIISILFSEDILSEEHRPVVREVGVKGEIRFFLQDD